MLRRGVFIGLSIMLLALGACSSRDKEKARTDNPPPAAQAPAPQAPQAPAQQPEASPQPEAQPARTVSEEPVRHPASRPASPKSASAPASRPAAAAPAAVPTAPPSATPVNPAPTPPQPIQPPPPPAPPKPLVIPAGTHLEVRLLDPISSANAKSGDTFKASLEQDLESDGKIVVPRGSTITGKLMGVKSSGRVEGRATLSMTLTDIAAGPASYPIQTDTLSFEAEKTIKQDATKVGIGAGLGAVIGAIAGGGKGAAIGAAVGGGAGTATVLATKGKEVQFGLEQKFSFVLRGDLVVRQ